MGTYTTNKNLFMPTVGEQGWGTLVNSNFETIDNFLKPITVSGSTYTFTGNQTGGTITATKITNSGTLTNTGKITANGGVGTTSLTTSSTITSTGKITGNGGIAGTTGTFSGAVTGASFNNVPIKKSITVTPNNTYSPHYSYSGNVGVDAVMMLLPPIYGHVYNGSFRFYNDASDIAVTIAYRRFNNAWENKTLSIPVQSYGNITLTNADMLLVINNDSASNRARICCYTLS